MRIVTTWFVVAVAAVAAVVKADAPRPLFDGASLAGWETVEADARWWKAANGMLVGGSSGMAVVAGLRVARQAKAKDVVVILIPDSGRGYLGKVFNDEWMIALL